MIKLKEAVIFAAIFLGASIVLFVLFYFSESFHPKDATTVLAAALLIRAFMAMIDRLQQKTKIIQLKKAYLEAQRMSPIQRGSERQWKM